MLWAILNKSWMQHPPKQQLYGHQPPISKTIQIRLSGDCWRSKEKLMIKVLWWSPSHGWANVGQPARTPLQQLCTDTGCSLENLLEVMDIRDKWRDLRFELWLLIQFPMMIDIMLNLCYTICLYVSSKRITNYQWFMCKSSDWK